MVEPFGLDEAWLDISEDYKNDALTIAKEISQRIKDEIGITVSIGVSFNKIFAKFGSDYKSLTQSPALHGITTRRLYGIHLQAICCM